MAFGVKCSVESRAVAALAKRLTDIKPKAADKAMRKAFAEIGRKVRDDARALVRVDRGTLKKSIGWRVGKSRDGRHMFLVVGPRVDVRANEATGRADRKRRAPHAHLVEYGRAELRAEPGKVFADKAAGVVYGAVVKAVPPHPFLRPAWERNKASAVGAMIRHLAAALKSLAAGSRRSGRRA